MTTRQYTVDEFCGKFSACLAGCAWAQDKTMKEVWNTARPTWLLWVATRTGVTPLLPKLKLLLYLMRCHPNPSEELLQVADALAQHVARNDFYAIETVRNERHSDCFIRTAAQQIWNVVDAHRNGCINNGQDITVPWEQQYVRESLFACADESSFAVRRLISEVLDASNQFEELQVYRRMAETIASDAALEDTGVLPPELLVKVATWIRENMTPNFDYPQEYADSNSVTDHNPRDN